ncbi:hypothetical protein KKA93_01490, partial [Patescibacteria group bacterium]|nr:hypothetical protein [Patescibacteria group bacterium]MBU1933884.1 hypothetical protein [Patescibacteria group bacterium]
INVILNSNIEIINIADTKRLSSFLIKNKIDLLVINSWDIIPNEIINLPKYKTINIHPSLLPQYRGALPTLWSLKNNDKTSALTYIVLNEFIDDGLIVNQHPFEIKPSDDWCSIEKKIALILKKTIAVDILSYLNGDYLPIKTSREISFTGYYDKYREINLLNETAREIYNKVGLYPYLEPFFYCFLSILGRSIFIKRIAYCRRLIKNKDIFPGKISIKLYTIFFFAKDGILKLNLFKDINFFDSIFLILNKITNKI